MGERTKAMIYARCSTDEQRQDVEVQLKELRRFCEASDWQYDEVQEYDSGFNGEQHKLKAVLEQIRRKQYDVLVVYSFDRFSRQHPRKVNALLDQIVYDHHCRFVSRTEGVDSDNELLWGVIRHVFIYFANQFSNALSLKIRAGIQVKRQKGLYRGGRPRKPIDSRRLGALHKECGANGHGWRTIAARYNEGLPPKKQLSYAHVRRVLLKLPQNAKHGSAPKPACV